MIGKSKKGTTSVFLTMILASILFAVGVFIHQAAQSAGRSYSDAVLELAGRSILSEYDIPLQERYGIFAVSTDESEAESKLKYYADYSFHDNQLKEALRNRRYLDPLKLELQSVSVTFKGYSITNIDLFEKQVLDDMKIEIVKDILPKGKDDQSNQRSDDAVLCNDQIINGLPSYGYEKSSLDIKRLLKNGIPSPDEIGKSGSNTYLADEYIMSHFYTRRGSAAEQDTFFANEVEYILSGNFSDKENYSDVRRNLMLIRTGLNLAHIYGDPQKRNEVAALAELITPGPAAILTQAVINGLWSAAEAENDLRRLEDGKSVPLVKTKRQWALALDNVVQSGEKQSIAELQETVEANAENDNLELGESLQSNQKKSGYIEPDNKDGINYDAYLRILLFLENREIKLLRCMDLIQLNMKGSYYEEFDLTEYYGGFQFEAVVSGKTYTYIQKY